MTLRVPVITRQQHEQYGRQTRKCIRLFISKSKSMYAREHFLFLHYLTSIISIILKVAEGGSTDHLR